MTKTGRKIVTLRQSAANRRRIQFNMLNSENRMNFKGADEFLEAAKKGVVTVEFNKIDTGELRVMPCTLNTEISNGKVQDVVEQKSDNDHFAVWSLDKEAWRSFRTSTVIRWYNGYPSEASDY
jgi:hypothetical protein